MDGVRVKYSELPDTTREIAERELTRKQLDVLKLWLAGAGTARIATMLDISEATARGHLKRARQKLKIHLRRTEDAA